MVSKTMLQLGTTRSCIRELFEYGNRQAAIVGRENVYDYSIGNPSIPAPAQVNESIHDILDSVNSLAVHGYTSGPGNMDARRAVAEDLNRRYDAGIRPENVFITCGAAPALISAIRALALPGTEIIGVAPFFPEYRPFTEANGAKFVVVPADTQKFQIRLDKLEELINPNTQAIIINSPNNPSGAVYTLETLTALARLLERKSAQVGHPIYIIADEPYRELVYDGATVPFIPNVYPNTIVSYSWSKSLSLPGERIGYFLVPDRAADSAEVFAACAGAARVLGHVCAPSLQQLTVARCVGLRPDLEAYDRNRRTLYDALTSYGYNCVKPEGAFYMFVEAPGGDAQAFSDRCKEKNLLVVPGGDFGCPDYFRISTCVDHNMILRSLPVFREMIETR